MNPLGIVVSTPLFQIFAVYAVFYHRDIGRLLKPLVEHSGAKTWKKVLASLGLAEDGAIFSPDRQQLKRILWLVLPTALMSLLCPIVVPGLLQSTMPALVRYGEFVTAGLQFIPAAYFLNFLSVWYLGRVPYPPRRMILPYPRMGSRIRHLAKFHD